MNYSQYLIKNRINQNIIKEFTDLNKELVKSINEYMNESNLVFNDIAYFDLIESLRRIQVLKQATLIISSDLKSAYFDCDLLNCNNLDEYVAKIVKGYNESKLKCSDVLKFDFELSDKDIFLNFSKFKRGDINGRPDKNG